MNTITASELRGANESPRANYARTATGIVIGASWLRKPTPFDAQAITGPHRREATLADKVIYRLAVPLGLFTVAALIAAERL
jgi:hypothetical protein